MLSLVLLFLIVAFTSHGSCRSLPKYLPKCCIDDPKLNECLLNATKTLRPYIRKGIKEIGIPSYAPLIIPYWALNEHSDAVNFTAGLKNSKFRAMGNYNFTDFQYDPTSMKFSGEVSFPIVFLNTFYDINGVILTIPIVGSGLGVAAIGPVNATFEISGKMTKRGNKEYYNPTDVKSLYKFEDLSVYIEGLFNGNYDLAATTNKLLNQNSKLVIAALTPGFSSVADAFLARYLKWLFQSFPFEELFPRCN